jgi:tetratricopeptide (TPR) repeat protein
MKTKCREKQNVATNLIEDREIRIFLSSTFKDMEQERNYLVNMVFPGLSKLCRKRDVTLFEVDLRWGVPDDPVDKGRTVEICLDEVNKTHPFFIGILGDRYGSVPKDDKAKLEAITAVLEDRKEYSWVGEELEKGASITEIEIQNGFLRPKDDVHAYFYFRSPSMAVPWLSELKAESDNSKLKLDCLKKKILDKNPDFVRNYSSIEDLGKLVKEDFEDLLNKLFPEEGGISDLEKERLEQWAFLRSKTVGYVPIPEMELCLSEFAENDGPCLVITGDSGMGKSTLLANWIYKRIDSTARQKTGRARFKRGEPIFHFIGQSGAQGDYRKIMMRLIGEIRDIYPSETASVEQIIQQDGADRKIEELQNLFFAIKETGKLILVFDGVDKLTDDDAKLFNWLLNFPPNVKIIFSTKKHDVSMDFFSRMKYSIHDMPVISMKMRKQMILDYLELFKKDNGLNNEQIENITKDKKSENPLVLNTVLEELRIFGNRKGLDNEIHRYIEAENITKWFDMVLDRFEKTFNDIKGNFVKDVLSLLFVSRNGLSEEEICELNGPPAKPTPMLYWVQLFDGMAYHLTVRGGLIVFSNVFIRDAVKKRYLAEDAAVAEYRKRIAEYMNSPSVSDERRKNDEVPYQLFELGDWDALYSFLLNFSVFEYLLKKEPYELGKYWRTLRNKDKEKYSIEKYLKLDAKGRKKAEIGVLFGGLSAFTSEMLSSPSLAVSFGSEGAAILEDVYGINHTETAKAYMALGVAYGILDNRELQLDYILKALSIYKKQLGEEHPVTAYMYFLAGTTYPHFKGKIQKGIDFLLQGIAIQEKILGPDHIDTAKSYIGLASLYQAKVEDYRMSLRYSLRAAEACEKSLGRNNPLTADAYSHIATAYLLVSNFERAAGYAEYALEIFKKVCGENSSVTQRSCDILAEVYHMQVVMGKSQDEVKERFNRFLNYMLESLDSFSKIFGEQDERTARYLKWIGDGYNCIGDPQNQLAYYQCALSKFKNISDRGITITTNAQDDIASIQKEMKSLEETKTWNSLDFSDEEKCIKYVERDGRILKFVPPEMRTEAVCLAAVQADGYALENVPQNMLTSEICFAAVQQNGAVLAYVPYVLRTEEICFEAIRRGGWPLSAVPEKLKTKEMCLEAIKYDDFKTGASGMVYVPQSMQTEEFCVAAIEVNPQVLKWLDPDLRTEKVCRIAIEADGYWGLMYTPPEIKTRELCITAVKQDDWALSWVPEKLLTDEFYSEADIKENGRDFE